MSRGYAAILVLPALRTLVRRRRGDIIPRAIWSTIWQQGFLDLPRLDQKGGHSDYVNQPLIAPPEKKAEQFDWTEVVWHGVRTKLVLREPDIRAKKRHHLTEVVTTYVFFLPSRDWGFFTPFLQDQRTVGHDRCCFSNLGTMTYPLLEQHKGNAVHAVQSFVHRQIIEP
jgi:hypothetical protein